MVEEKQIRKSNIELLRIIAIVLIVLSHVLPKCNNIDLNYAGLSLEKVVLVFFKYCGQIGNVLFIVITSYFLAGNSKKVNVKKLLSIIINMCIISWIFLVIFAKIGIVNNRITILNYAFPFMYNLNYWFPCCYILFYAIHPLLNTIIENTSKETLGRYNIGFIILYCILNILATEPQFYYTDLVGFIGIYFIVAYIKLYAQDFFNSFKENFIILMTSLICLVLFIMAIERIGMSNSYVFDKVLCYCKLYNILVIGIARPAFNIFYNFVKIKENVLINYIASLPLYVYMITDNYLLRERVRSVIFNENLR